jgi:hypothetical protein
MKWKVNKMEEGQNVKNGPGTPPPDRGVPLPPYGGHHERPAYDVHYHYYYEPPKAKPGKSSKPTIAGALLIIHGILAIILAGLLIWGGTFLADMDEDSDFFGFGNEGDITGMVTYQNGTPAEGVTITVMDTEKTTQTDADGLFSMYNVPAGNQKILVEKDGYNTIEYKTFINPSSPDGNKPNNQNQDNDYDFTITPGNEVVEQGTYVPLELIGAFLYVCGAIVIILAIISIVGGVFALQRRNYGFTLAAGVAGIFSLGILAAIALFILIISKDEFKKQDETPPPTTPGGGPETPDGPP